MKKQIGIVLAVIALGVGWYLFRPERLFIDQTVNEALPGNGTAVAAASGATVPLAVGQFHGVAHQTHGTVTLHQLTDGRRVLRFTDFETSNGPDVQVYLIAAADAADNDTVKKAGFVTLGALKGNKGDQNYDVPADVDFGKYKAVTVWCRRFGVNFATAPLAFQKG